MNSLLVTCNIRKTLKQGDLSHDFSITCYRGGEVNVLLPTNPGEPSALEPACRDWDILLTAETHNFPCAVAPYPGAETHSKIIICLLMTEEIAGHHSFIAKCG